ncbi:hypothetical protein [Aliidiomarina maris]|uniref:Uncharacterized protein n=1 Tax=Aliidiomarina maris TaxID=531312 RepID=A0A327X0J5_9GAMM|nr:hypothetical protein [Aliidiomarina maris]RAJ98814.1 hypothetical protein B0I24_10415 [Aliidiomarina maris]RUO24962.1 hypothetical protein CWE07_05645 [Aliidiomarina maris]
MNISSSVSQTYTPSQTSPVQEAKQTEPAKNTAKSGDTPEILSGVAMMKMLGASVLGKDNIEQWEAKGLELDDAAYEKAFEVFNEAFKWGNSQGGDLSGISYSFNAYDIVASAQNVPEWFETERTQYIKQQQHPGVREAFADGALWYGHINSVFA